MWLLREVRQTKWQKLKLTDHNQLVAVSDDLPDRYQRDLRRANRRSLDQRDVERWSIRVSVTNTTLADQIVGIIFGFLACDRLIALNQCNRCGLSRRCTTSTRHRR
jgi:hypothetical protein